MKPKFYALVAHGLNLKPEKMQSYRTLLEQLGGKTELVEFSGHKKGSAKLYNSVQKEQWLTDLDLKFQKYLSEDADLPLYYLGFAGITCVCCLPTKK